MRRFLASAVLVLLVGPALAGCITDTLDLPTDTAAVTPQPAEAGLTRYLHNLSEPIPGVEVVTSIVEQIRIPMADGILVDTWIVRPDVDGPVPIVLEVTPYYAGGSPISLNGERHSLGRVGDALVPRGFAVGIVSVRGTGNSGGCFTQGGPDEAKDTAAVIEHVASQPWSNGNVGLIGVSYPGTTPQDVWIEAPSALKTIVPISGISDFYKYNFVNGVPIMIQGFAFNTYYWGMVGAASGFPPSPNTFRDPTSVPGGFVGEACPEQVEVQEGGVSSTADGNKDGYWQLRDFRRELDEAPDVPRASVFYIHGLQDWNVKPHHMEDWIDAIQDEGVAYKVWLGQWNHNWPQREDWWNTTIVAWFDEYLKGVDTGIMDAPAVQVQHDDGVWRHEMRWPPADTESITFHLQSDETMMRDAPGSGTVTYQDNNGREGTSLVSQPNDRVVFVSDPLEEDMVISGFPTFTANVTASGTRASLMLTLFEVTGSTTRSINYAALSLNHVGDLAAGRSDISGVEQFVDGLRFFPQDDIVHKGSRLMLVAAPNLVAAGPGPSLQPVSTGSEITIRLDGATFTIPVDRSIVAEDPQPCWEGIAKGDGCRLIR